MLRRAKKQREKKLEEQFERYSVFIVKNKKITVNKQDLFIQFMMI